MNNERNNNTAAGWSLLGSISETRSVIRLLLSAVSLSRNRASRPFPSPLFFAIGSSLISQ